MRLECSARIFRAVADDALAENQRAHEWATDSIKRAEEAEREANLAWWWQSTTEPVLTGRAADRITERLDELADLDAIMREPARPSVRDQNQTGQKGKKGVVLVVGIVPAGTGGSS